MSAMKIDREYTPGLHRVSERCYAWLQPGGGFCLNNAGLFHDDGESLLVDTLIDLPRTQAMLDAMAAAVPAARKITTLVNTHSHPDHTGGNSLLEGAEIIMTATCAREYAPIEQMVKLDKLAGEALLLMRELGVEAFESQGVRHVPPTRSFEGEYRFKVGRTEVLLKEIGKGHTGSDTLVFIPAEGVVFAGDLMFADCHLVLNHPGIGNWIGACDTMLGCNADTFVPGHGRVCGREEVVRHRDYLLLLKAEARRRFDSGMPVGDAAFDLFRQQQRFSSLYRADLLYKNIAALYAEFSGTPLAGGFAEHMADRWRFRNKIRGSAPGIHQNHVPDGN